MVLGPPHDLTNSSSSHERHDKHPSAVQALSLQTVTVRPFKAMEYSAGRAMRSPKVVAWIFDFCKHPFDSFHIARSHGS